jgi:hypothetical protein
VSNVDTLPDEDGNWRAFAIVIAGFDAFVSAIVVATTAFPFAEFSLTMEGTGLLILFGVLGLTALPAVLLALRSRWHKTAAALALSFPLLLVAASIAVMSTLD